MHESAITHLHLHVPQALQPSISKMKPNIFVFPSQDLISLPVVSSPRRLLHLHHCQDRESSLTLSLLPPNQTKLQLLRVLPLKDLLDSLHFFVSSLPPTWSTSTKFLLNYWNNFLFSPGLLTRCWLAQQGPILHVVVKVVFLNCISDLRHSCWTTQINLPNAQKCIFLSEASKLFMAAPFQFGLIPRHLLSHHHHSKPFEIFQMWHSLISSACESTLPTLIKLYRVASKKDGRPQLRVCMPQLMLEDPECHN